MHAASIVHRFLDASLEPMHSARRRLLGVVVLAAMQGHWLGLTWLARGIAPAGRVKGAIKRIERLVGNPRVVDEGEWAAQALLKQISRFAQPLILSVDWSSLSQRGRFVELRAAVSWRGAGRALPVYQQVHPEAMLGNRQVERAFLCKLRGWIARDVRVIVVTDAGFRRPWFAQVTQLGFEWVGRVRRGVALSGDGVRWAPAAVWFEQATRRARRVSCWLTRRFPLACDLVLYRRAGAGRSRPTPAGARACTHRASRQLRARVREREPWLLVHSPTLVDLRPDEIVAIYSLRMQIEESFRDSKSPVFGMGFEVGQSRTGARLHGLLFVATVTAFLLWHLGQLAEAEGLHKRFKLTTRTTREISHLTLGRLLCQQASLALSDGALSALLRRLGVPR